MVVVGEKKKKKNKSHRWWWLHSGSFAEGVVIERATGTRLLVAGINSYRLASVDVPEPSLCV